MLQTPTHTQHTPRLAVTHGPDPDPLLTRRSTIATATRNTHLPAGPPPNPHGHHAWQAEGAGDVAEGAWHAVEGVGHAGEMALGAGQTALDAGSGVLELPGKVPGGKALVSGVQAATHELAVWAYFLTVTLPWRCVCVWRGRGGGDRGGRRGLRLGSATALPSWGHSGAHTSCHVMGFPGVGAAAPCGRAALAFGACGAQAKRSQLLLDSPGHPARPAPHLLRCCQSDWTWAAAAALSAVTAASRRDTPSTHAHVCARALALISHDPATPGPPPPPPPLPPPPARPPGCSPAGWASAGMWPRVLVP